MDIIRDPNLVLYAPLWKKDAANAQSFMSDDAYGHLCTVTEATWGIQGRTFDGTDDKIVVGYNAATDLTTTYTAIIWFKSTEATNFQGLYGKTGTITGSIACYRGTANTLTYHHYDGVGYSSFEVAVNVWTGAWFCAAITVNSNVAIPYINGIAYTGTTFNRTPGSGAAYTWNLGWYGQAATYIAATEGEFLLYNRVLTALEVQRNFLLTKWRYR